tara:strand:- start:2543 stop:3484 length:942 start_codon:yes stop_codon:yes gene_type:complete
MLVKKVYVRGYRPEMAAGHWIYKGYKNAWESLGYETVVYENLSDIKDAGPAGTYYLQAVDSDINSLAAYQVVKNSAKSFIYVQPNIFPLPWGSHPNFQCLCPDKFIELINGLNNTFLWCFDNIDGTAPFHTKWKKVNTLSLAFDSVAYKDIKDDRYAYDVCYIGGRANNGFDEKYKIMLNYFGKFRDSKRKIGIFISRNLTHEQENAILCNSKVCLNIHDNYQKTLVTKDTNERTFKSLGCGGILVSDKEGFVPENFPDVPIASTPDQMLALTEHYLNMPESELQKIREKHKKLIYEKHTYISRVKEELSFEQ